MSTDPIWEGGDGAASDGPETPFDDIETGTASDPVVESEETASVTVDGKPVTVAAGGTLLDAVEAVETEASVPALCADDHDERIGPRSECRTCMVETDDGLVPACSTAAEEGMAISTDAAAATEARDVNLDLLLSNHNLLCTTCGANGRCELQDVAIENDVVEPRYGVMHDRDELESLDDSSPFIQIDRNKCILCNRCVEACNDVQVEGVLRVEGSGQDTRIGFQNDADTMMGSTCVSCGHCATVCPTGALVEQGLVDATTLPVPWFTHKNSAEEIVGEDYEGQPGQMTPMKREVEARTDSRDDEPSTVKGDD